MAIDMCSESPSLGTSPRISFSHDLHHTDHDHDVSNENYPCRSDSSLLLDSDFNFCVGGDGIQNTEPSSADELFSGGLIRPLQIQQRFVTTSKHISISKPKSVVANLQPFLPLPTPSNVINVNDEASNSKQQSESKPQSKAFWRIKRSSSLHCDNSYKKSSFWSTLPQLLRSNSTGSVPNSKLTSNDSHHHKQNSHKQNRFSAATSSMSSSSSSSASVNVYSFSQKPPLKNNYGGSYGNGGVRISPVLNVPPPYISRGTTNLFGLGSLFRNGKDHKKNKK